MTKRSNDYITTRSNDVQNYILVFLGGSVLDLGLMYATDRRQI